MPEFGCRHCRPFLKKSSAKNFLAESFWEFSKELRSTVAITRWGFLLLNYVVVKNLKKFKKALDKMGEV
jgi:hypothetical protein